MNDERIYSNSDGTCSECGLDMFNDLDCPHWPGMPSDKNTIGVCSGCGEEKGLISCDTRHADMCLSCYMDMYPIPEMQPPIEF